MSSRRAPILAPRADADHPFDIDQDDELPPHHSADDDEIEDVFQPARPSPHQGLFGGFALQTRSTPPPPSAPPPRTPATGGKRLVDVVAALQIDDSDSDSEEGSAPKLSPPAAVENASRQGRSAAEPPTKALPLGTASAPLSSDPLPKEAGPSKPVTDGADPLRKAAPPELRPPHSPSPPRSEPRELHRHVSTSSLPPRKTPVSPTFELIADHGSKLPTSDAASYASPFHRELGSVWRPPPPAHLPARSASASNQAKNPTPPRSRGPGSSRNSPMPGQHQQPVPFDNAALEEAVANVAPQHNNNGSFGSAPATALLLADQDDDEDTFFEAVEGRQHASVAHPPAYPSQAQHGHNNNPIRKPQPTKPTMTATNEELLLETEGTATADDASSTRRTDRRKQSSSKTTNPTAQATAPNAPSVGIEASKAAKSVQPTAAQVKKLAVSKPLPTTKGSAEPASSSAAAATSSSDNMVVSRSGEGPAESKAFPRSHPRVASRSPSPTVVARVLPVHGTPKQRPPPSPRRDVGGPAATHQQQHPSSSSQPQHRPPSHTDVEMSSGDELQRIGVFDDAGGRCSCGVSPFRSHPVSSTSWTDRLLRKDVVESFFNLEACPLAVASDGTSVTGVWCHLDSLGQRRKDVLPPKRFLTICGRAEYTEAVNRSTDAASALLVTPVEALLFPSEPFVDAASGPRCLPCASFSLTPRPTATRVTMEDKAEEQFDEPYPLEFLGGVTFTRVQVLEARRYTLQFETVHCPLSAVLRTQENHSDISAVEMHREDQVRKILAAIRGETDVLPEPLRVVSGAVLTVFDGSQFLGLLEKMLSITLQSRRTLADYLEEQMTIFLECPLSKVLQEFGGLECPFATQWFGPSPLQPLAHRVPTSLWNSSLDRVRAVYERDAQLQATLGTLSLDDITFAENPAMLSHDAFGSVRMAMRTTGNNQQMLHDVRILPSNRTSLYRPYESSDNAMSVHGTELNGESALMIEYVSRFPYMQRIYGFLLDDSSQRLFVVLPPVLSQAYVDMEREKDAQSKAAPPRSAVFRFTSSPPPSTRVSATTSSETKKPAGLKTPVRRSTSPAPTARIEKRSECTVVLGELLRRMSTRRESLPLDGHFEFVRRVAAQLVLAIGLLHGKGICLGGLTPRRILCDVKSEHCPVIQSTIRTSVTGVGVSSAAWGWLRQQIGSVEYLSPAHLAQYGDGMDPAFMAADDWWALGCICFELLSCGVPLFGLPKPQSESTRQSRLQMFPQWTELLNSADRDTQSSRVRQHISNCVTIAINAHKKCIDSASRGPVGRAVSPSPARKNLTSSAAANRNTNTTNAPVSNLVARFSRPSSPATSMPSSPQKAHSCARLPKEQSEAFIDFLHALLDLSRYETADGNALCTSGYHGAVAFLMQMPFFHGVNWLDVYSITKQSCTVPLSLPVEDTPQHLKPHPLSVSSSSGTKADEKASRAVSPAPGPKTKPVVVPVTSPFAASHEKPNKLTSLYDPREAERLLQILAESGSDVERKVAAQARKEDPRLKQWSASIVPEITRPSGFLLGTSSFRLYCNAVKEQTKNLGGEVEDGEEGAPSLRRLEQNKKRSHHDPRTGISPLNPCYPFQRPKSFFEKVTERPLGTAPAEQPIEHQGDVTAFTKSLLSAASKKKVAERRAGYMEPLPERSKTGTYQPPVKETGLFGDPPPLANHWLFQAQAEKSVEAYNQHEEERRSKPLSSQRPSPAATRGKGVSINVPQGAAATNPPSPPTTVPRKQQQQAPTTTTVSAPRREDDPSWAKVGGWEVIPPPPPLPPPPSHHGGVENDRSVSPSSPVASIASPPGQWFVPKSKPESISSTPVSERGPPAAHLLASPPPKKSVAEALAAMRKLKSPEATNSNPVPVPAPAGVAPVRHAAAAAPQPPPSHHHHSNVLGAWRAATTSPQSKEPLKNLPRLPPPAFVEDNDTDISFS